MTRDAKAGETLIETAWRLPDRTRTLEVYLLKDVRFPLKNTYVLLRR